MKDAIHGHNSTTLDSTFYFLLHFLSFSRFLSASGLFFSASKTWLFIEKSQEVQANSPKRVVARPGECVAYGWRNLISPGELLASLGEWMSEILGNNHFVLPFDFVSGSNKQLSKPIESWMNLPYLNKNISKRTIYKTTRKKRSL